MDHFVVEAATYTTHNKPKVTYPCFHWESNPRPQKQIAADLHLRPHSHLERCGHITFCHSNSADTLTSSSTIVTAQPPGSVWPHNFICADTLTSSTATVTTRSGTLTLNKARNCLHSTQIANIDFWFRVAELLLTGLSCVVWGCNLLDISSSLHQVVTCLTNFTVSHVRRHNFHSQPIALSHHHTPLIVSVC
jgi:hypothetical protein